jgi:hypothetical protein
VVLISSHVSPGVEVSSSMHILVQQVPVTVQLMGRVKDNLLINWNLKNWHLLGDGNGKSLGYVQDFVENGGP